MTIYSDLGVPEIINACGTVTRLSGGLMAPEVAEAMRQASLACVDMVQLQAAASRTIREATGAEAGIVTSGASAAVLLGTAAILAGLDPAKMNALPDVPDGRREFLMVRSQRNMYDKALVVAGARIIEIGIPDRYSGPGVRDAAPWELEAAITKNTAGIYYLAGSQSKPSLREIATVAREHRLPILVDAAGQLPPTANLNRYLDEGADLVAFSGGKAIGGPQSSGILAGRMDLISSALLQMLDLDIYEDAWSPPAEFGPLRQMRGLPHHGIGRSCKIGKEEIAGLSTALKRFTSTDETTRRNAWLARLQKIADLAGGEGLSIEPNPIPILAVKTPDLDSAMALARTLAAGTPQIHCGLGRRDEGILTFNPVALTDAHAEEIGRRLAAR
jgi:L-seryl-tRNA(Ser) seleniumtransferase